MAARRERCGRVTQLVSRFDVWLRPQHVGDNQPDSRLVQVPLLERGDGTDPGRAPVLREDDLRQRHCRQYKRCGPPPLSPLSPLIPFVLCLSFCRCILYVYFISGRYLDFLSLECVDDMCCPVKSVMYQF